jgi:diaminopimelate epimerase
MKPAFKYQGLGNDFVMLDWTDQPYREALSYLETPSWVTEVQELTDRQSGIGADGLIVILKDATSSIIHALIYNQDGSYASYCGNGARCVADYLHHSLGFPDNFKFKMSSQLVECQFEELTAGKPGITILTPAAQYKGIKHLKVADKVFQAHEVDVGNPHLVILEPISLQWLKQHGKELEYYYGHTHRYNIEFVWPSDKAFHYHMLVHERGAGITQACGSGAMAATVALVETGHTAPLQKLTIQMPGGDAIVWLNDKQDIALHADAAPDTTNIVKTT